MSDQVPADAVKGSVRAWVDVIGDVMGPSLQGLEQLLRVPTGCGEQNMIGLAPNVYVATCRAAPGEKPCFDLH